MTEEEYDVLMDVTTSLIAAISLLERGGKKAAWSDKVFGIMIEDYRKSVERARAIFDNVSGSGSE